MLGFLTVESRELQIEYFRPQIIAIRLANKINFCSDVQDQVGWSTEHPDTLKGISVLGNVGWKQMKMNENETIL